MKYFSNINSLRFFIDDRSDLYIEFQFKINNNKVLLTSLKAFEESDLGHRKEREYQGLTSEQIVEVSQVVQKYMNDLQKLHNTHTALKLSGLVNNENEEEDDEDVSVLYKLQIAAGKLTAEFHKRWEVVFKKELNSFVCLLDLAALNTSIYYDIGNKVFYDGSWSPIKDKLEIGKLIAENDLISSKNNFTKPIIRRAKLPKHLENKVSSKP